MNTASLCSPEGQLKDLAKGILERLDKQLAEVRISIENDNASGTRSAARLLELASLPDLAAEAYSVVVTQDPSSAEARAQLVLALLKAKRLDEALEQALMLVGAYPKFEIETLLPNESVPTFALLGDAFA